MLRSKKSSIFIIFSLIFVSLLACLDASSDTLKQGDMLNSSTFLVSSNKIFTLGFFKPMDSNKRYLGIWYTDIPFQPMWVANRNTPLYDNSGVLFIDKAGKLIVTNNAGDPIRLYESESDNINITATLLDSGNFVVSEENSYGSTKQPFWESFDYPTDTLLPGMKLGVNHRTGKNWTLTSWFAENELASGPFSLEWDPRGHRLVVRRRGVIYWTSGVSKDKAFEFMPKTDPMNIKYDFTSVTNEEEEYFTYSLVKDHEFMPGGRRVKSGWVLDYQGRIYDQDMTSIAQVNLCYGYNTKISKVNGGWELWEQPKCRNRHQKFNARSGYFGDTGKASHVDDNQSLSLSDCRDICWNDCDCIGFRSSGFSSSGTGCIFWRGNLEFHQDYSGVTIVHYVLISEALNNREKKWIWIVSAVVVSLFMLLFSLFFFLRRRRIKLQGKNEERVLLELMTPNGYMNMDELEHDGNKGYDLKVFSFSCIVDATSSFSSERKLGEGGFGPVYKGKLPEGHEVAIKRLSRSSGQGLVEFKNELILIPKLQHMNLVRLLGCCIQGDEKMLVYEYMPNKNTTKKEQLTWERRLSIIEGIAQGLLYLHKVSRLKIIHRDLKVSNILLDENMNPKISDFGMAKIYKQSVLEATTNRVVGTYGYMAPEYVIKGIFSVKSDVFSFGVLILEILSGRKNSSFNHIEGPLNLIGFAWELWNNDDALELVDPTLRGSCIEQRLLIRCIHVGLLCVEDRAIDRPTMLEVVSMLTNDGVALPMPKKPAFLTGSGVVEEDLHKRKSKKYSVNGVSNSAIHAR